MDVRDSTGTPSERSTLSMCGMNTSRGRHHPFCGRTSGQAGFREECGSGSVGAAFGVGLRRSALLCYSDESTHSSSAKRLLVSTPVMRSPTDPPGRTRRNHLRRVLPSSALKRFVIG